MTGWRGYAARTVHPSAASKETDQYGKQRVRVGQEKVPRDNLVEMSQRLLFSGTPMRELGPILFSQEIHGAPSFPFSFVLAKPHRLTQMSLSPFQ